MGGKYLSLWVPILVLLSCSSGQAQAPLSLPEPALRLLAESARESCSLCARQLKEKAYDLLERDFPPGKHLVTAGSCLLIRSPGAEENELVLSCAPAGQEPLPVLVFRFHTPENPLVGIGPEDFTADGPAGEYRAAAPGTAFQGELKIISFRYGDRPSFFYAASRSVIQVHCRIMDLRRE